MRAEAILSQPQSINKSVARPPARVTPQAGIAPDGHVDHRVCIEIASPFPGGIPSIVWDQSRQSLLRNLKIASKMNCIKKRSRRQEGPADPSA
jgi:hypothetical protein